MYVKDLILTGKDEYDSKYDSKIIEDIDDINDEFTLYNSNFKSSVLYWLSLTTFSYKLTISVPLVWIECLLYISFYRSNIYIFKFSFIDINI